MRSFTPFLIVAGALVAAFVLPGAGAHAQGTVLHGTVGPGFNIALTDAAGSVSHVENGTYTIVVDDKSEEHNFHLSGPGVDQATPVEFIGTVTWTVTLTDGVYRYQCDPHAPQMNGSFTAGTPPVTLTTPTPKPKPRVSALVGTVGPASISLRKTSGGSAKTLSAGKYVVTARDRSAAQNFRLIGPGVNKSTGVAFVGTRTWTVTLRRGTYRFQSDPAKTRLRGSIRVT
jgi:hypothetical protein